MSFIMALASHCRHVLHSADPSESSYCARIGVEFNPTPPNSCLWGQNIHLFCNLYSTNKRKLSLFPLQNSHSKTILLIVILVDKCPKHPLPPFPTLPPAWRTTSAATLTRSKKCPPRLTTCWVLYPKKTGSVWTKPAGNSPRLPENLDTAA